MTTDSARSSQTIAAMGRADTLGKLVKRYITAIGAFVAAASWGISQLAQGWDTFREWKAQMGLWPVIALIAIGAGAVHAIRQRTVTKEILTTVTEHTAQVTAAISQLAERDARHDMEITELRADRDALRQEVAELRALVDPTGQHRRA